jgi:putative ABC transport system permease protein
MVLAAPGAVRLAAAPAARLPLAPRLALRDLARHQARAAAALAAITLGLGISVFVVALASASVPSPSEGNLSSRQLLVRMADVGSEVQADQTEADRTAADQRAAKVASVVPGAAVLPLDLVVNPAGLAAGVPDPVGLATPTGPNSFRDRGPLYAATPQLLAGLGIDPSTIRPGAEVLTALPRSESPDLRLIDMAPRSAAPGEDPRDRGPGPERSVVQRVDLPGWTDSPRSLVTEPAMAAHGWTTVRSGWLVQTDHDLTHDELVAARRAAAAVGMTVDHRDSVDALALLRTIATAVGVVLALAIVALTLGLLRGEAAQDLRTLTATGARGRTRRSLTATTAGARGLAGALMGTATPKLAIATGYRSDQGELLPRTVPPLAALLVGLPLLATALGWILSGREPAALGRQLLD